ncbi:exopolysaccharide biosynthesis protein [Coraliomargarita akajimensis]|uniref:Exopolysaccharide synthesis ExoD n=1 Tax=Coraliomargarita akajimensis (strain DSM 45221 / IAM 15411 / JCM 23193 / KCTC 12865 / 04OKA010-24) TaxID=583355 RepID=D5EJ41_CORAD|nr:exopolysaccharide biosynthesis protein [Coraliomargarita akajimensis]ADE54440.1 Exopolysaccharide synthesis ExoD [Coraliomargarita akajimensis DSM 45221]
MYTAPEEHHSLAETLESLLESQHDKGPSIGELTEAVGDKGFGLLLMILSLPSALPVPAPGYSTPFGIAIALIAAQMLVGRHSVWLPNKIRDVRIAPKLASKMIGAASKFLRTIEHLIRPRQRWIRSRGGQAGLATVIIIMSCLMMLPIPLTNTFPAMVIFMIGIGLSEEDGLLAIAAFGVGIGAVALYGYIIYLVITQGPEAVDGIKDWIKGLLGMGGDEATQ